MKILVGQGSCGIASGAKKTAVEFEKQIREQGLTGITVEKTGCVGSCFLEPIVDVYDDEGNLEVRYVGVQPERVADIVKGHLIGGERAI